MKQWIFIGMLFFFLGVKAQEYKINWMTLPEAIEAQKTNPKKIMMDVYTTWCGPCKMLDQHTFQNKDVSSFVNENFYAVKFNAEGNESLTYQDQAFSNPDFNPASTGRNAQHQLAQALQITAYPTIYFFDEQGLPIMPIPGYHSPKQLELYLKLFLNDDHKKIQTKEEWESYQNVFQSEFEG